jgi:glycogen debranching enzyme
MSGVDRIEEIERRSMPGGAIHIVNVWYAAVEIPASLRELLGHSAFAWTDRAEWSAAGVRCRFRVEPHFLRECIRCKGETSLEDSMGGRATRIRYEGDLELGPLPGVGKLLGASRAVEQLVADLIVQNLQETGRALSRALRHREP